MAKDTRDQRHNAIVQNDITRRQGNEAAAKRIKAEVDLRKQQMGPTPDPEPKDYLGSVSGDRFTGLPGGIIAL